jgi:succinate dehydrogenase/fumarate reductase flavoprotein subunit
VTYTIWLNITVPVKNAVSSARYIKEVEMAEEKEAAKKLSRRQFVKGAAAGAAGVAAVGALASCAPAATPVPTTAPGETAVPAATCPPAEECPPCPTPEAVAEKWSFETPPAPIAESEIKNTVTTEIVVVGAGTAGLVCANAAIESGAQVVLFSASSVPVSRGGVNHALNTKTMARLGLEVDVPKAMKARLADQLARVDAAKWWLWAYKSAEAMDWLSDMMEVAGYQTEVEVPVIDAEGILTLTPGAHVWSGGEIPPGGMSGPWVVKVLSDKLLEQGGQIDWSMRAVQLIRENNNTGRVTAVIAEAPDGSYTKYVGTKAIVLATGDFGRDKEMVAKYCPEVLPLVSPEPVDYDTGMTSMGGVYGGDGHKMCLWVGAAFQKIVPAAFLVAAGRLTVGNGKSMILSQNGVRYVNEDTLGAYRARAQMMQPDTKGFSIWDTKLAERGVPWEIGNYGHRVVQSVEDVIAGWDKTADAGTSAFGGTYVKADTIDEVAQKLELPVDAVKATIERYNRFCQTGVDEDLGKRAGLLFPVDTGPFYGSVEPALYGTVFGGMRCNTKMQVLDEKEQVIPGLYVVGTLVGDMWSQYDLGFHGQHLGANCITFGYLTGKGLAEGTV